MSIQLWAYKFLKVAVILGVASAFVNFMDIFFCFVNSWNKKIFELELKS